MKYTQKTSWFWWLGLGMFLSFGPERVKIRKGFRSATLYYGDITGAHTERRFFRGHTLVIKVLDGKPIYFRTTKRQAVKAMHFINAKATDFKAYL